MGNQFYSRVTTISRRKYTEIPRPSRPVIKDSDYNIGYITRYFVRSVTNPNTFVTEVDEKNFDALSKNPFYLTVKLKWNISAPLSVEYGKSAQQLNMEEILDKSKTISDLKRALPNLLEFHISKESLLW